jgi:hypothetical protein
LRLPRIAYSLSCDQQNDYLLGASAHSTNRSRYKHDQIQKGKKCPIPLRRIRFVRQEDEKEITLISNDLNNPAEEIMALYKQR